MKRMTDWEVIKANIYPTLMAVGLILIGLITPFLPSLFPAADYSELISNEISVEYVRWVSYRGGGNWQMVADDGTRYNITGRVDPNIEDMKGLLSGAESVKIQFYERRLLFFTKRYAEEVWLDGECIVRFDNDEKQPLWPIFLVSGVSITVGVCTGCLVIWSVKNNRRKQAIRDRKIIRKYGQLRKK